MSRKCPFEALLAAQRAQIERLEAAATVTEGVDLKLEDALMRALRQQATLYAEVRKMQEEKKAAAAEKNGFGKLPVCIAKTQYSFSDNPTAICAPEGFVVTVKNVNVAAGAGFVVVYLGDILTMPGLPEHPAAENIDVDENGNITGLF